MYNCFPEPIPLRMADETLESINERILRLLQTYTYVHDYNNLKCSERNIKVQLSGYMIVCKF